MKKINYLFAFLALCMHSFVMKSSCITLAGGNTIYALPPSYSFGNAGTLSGLASGAYAFSFSRSGAFTTSNLAIALNGSGWTEGTYSFISASNNIAISGYIPAGVGCGQTETVAMTITDLSGSTVCTYTFYITKTSQSINGSNVLCINSTGTYAVSSPVSIGGSYVWTTNTAGWLINGLASPVTTTTNTVTLTAPATKGATNLCVSNPNMCQSLCFAVSSNDLATPVFTTPHSMSVCRTNSIFWHISPVAGASGYTWTFTGSSGGVTLVPGGTSCEIIGNTLGPYSVKVKATNMCGSSALLNGPLSVVNSSGCPPKRMAAGLVSTTDESNVIVFPNPASQQVSVEMTSVESGIYNISVYDMLGKRYYSQALSTGTGSVKVNIDVSGLENGMYLLLVENEHSSIKQRLIVNH